MTPSTRRRSRPVASTSPPRRDRRSPRARLRRRRLRARRLGAPDSAVEVADRASQEAGAEVEAEDQRRLGDRLEVDRAVAGPLRPVLGLADEAGLHERLQRERDRRLRDAGAAGDLGAGDRRPGADRLEDGALVQVLEKGRCGAGLLAHDGQ